MSDWPNGFSPTTHCNWASAMCIKVSSCRIRAQMAALLPEARETAVFPLKENQTGNLLTKWLPSRSTP